MGTAIHWFWCKPVPGSRTWKIGRAKSGSFYCQTWKGVQYSCAGTPVDTEQTVVTSAEQLSNFLPPMPGLQCNDSRGGNKYGNATDKI